MPEIRLRVTLPEVAWVGEVSRSFPDATFRVQSAIPGDDAGFGLVSVAGGDFDDILGAVEDHPAIADVTTIQRSDRQLTLQFETRAPLLMFSMQSAGLVVSFPVEIEDGTATIDVTGPSEKLSALGSHLSSFGLEYEVRHVRAHRQRDQLLTETQKELLTTAIEAGYYDTPRQCSLTELAKEVGIAKSTCSETLHRAEGVVLKTYFEELPPRSA